MPRVIQFSSSVGPCIVREPPGHALNGRCPASDSVAARHMPRRRASFRGAVPEHMVSFRGALPGRRGISIAPTSTTAQSRYLAAAPPLGMTTAGGRRCAPVPSRIPPAHRPIPDRARSTHGVIARHYSLPHRVIPRRGSMAPRNLYRTDHDDRTIEIPRGCCAARHDKPGGAPPRRRELNGPG